LAVIDESWKEHLRQMDDLRQAVRNAVYEQKDPLLIYKFEAFELFKKMVADVNQEITAFLHKASIPLRSAGEVKQGQVERTDMSGVRASHQEAVSATSNPAAAARVPQPAGAYDDGSSARAAGAAAGRSDAPRVQQVVRTEKKVGRNDPCPCGSGKKYKQCHGREA
jgi:preprotein translocase subunit SecA